jgi:ADP-ribosylglycohydrolase
MSTDFSRALQSLEGLSIGDAFGQLFFTLSPRNTSPSDLPKQVWHWTDDTHMALSIVEVLKIYGHIDPDALSQAFARRYREDPHRGYGSGAARLLDQVASGSDWRTASPALFGNGSYGNGAAMRVAPLGGFFYQDFGQVVKEAELSAVVTHAHPEGQAGAIAVAVAAAIAANTPHPSGREFLHEVLKGVPESITRKQIQTAIEIPAGELQLAVKTLGSGSNISAQDTVPFCLWSAAYYLDNYEEALWHTAKGMGDRDTTCAIVGGIVSLSAKELPVTWQKQREPLPDL